MSRAATRALVLALLAGPAVPPVGAAAQADHLEIKWVRDSREFSTLVRQTYRLAGEKVLSAAARLPAGTRWAVILDVDETTLDNSVYQLERAAYGARSDSAAWNAWVRRQQGAPVPGVAEFLAAVRAGGGRVAFIGNREEALADPTRANLRAQNLFRDGDHLCLRAPAGPSSKRGRRTEVRTGAGPCAWPNESMAVLAYVGDTLGDFPEADEEAGEFGERFFIIPNPLYGTWDGRE
jgi:5'-nucleotidase (lipoprotein e(P4) family)